MENKQNEKNVIESQFEGSPELEIREVDLYGEEGERRIMLGVHHPKVYEWIPVAGGGFKEVEIHTDDLLIDSFAVLGEDGVVDLIGRLQSWLNKKD